MPSNPTADESPSPTQTPPGPVMFQAPPPRPGRPPSATSTSTPPPPSTNETTPHHRAESSTPAEPDWSTSQHPAGGGSDARSSISSDSPGSKRGAQLVAEDIRGALINATEAAANGLTDDVGRALGQFRATEDELDEVSEAAAGLLARRVPRGVGNPDVADLIRVGLAVIAYGGRQFRILRAARAARRKMASAAEGQNGGETSA